MKVTRLPQSCLLIEKDNQKIVIDPGVHFLQTHRAEELQGVTAVLYTHQHADHYDPTLAETLKAWNIPLYANQATAALIGSGCTVVATGQQFEAAGFAITARDLPHCLLVNGDPGPQNTGYIIDGALFHPGDGTALDGLTVATLALPIAGPSISMHDAANFAQQVQAKVVIPIHYQGVPGDPNMFKSAAEKANLPFEVRVLADGESTEV